jgi:hypothetical protein
MPTHRTAADTQQDKIRFKNLVRAAEHRLLEQGLRTTEFRDFLKPMHALLGDYDFWKHQSDGLVLFLSPQMFRHYRLPLVFDELIVVTNRFHTKPLLPLFEGDNRFYVLAISQNEVRLLECTRHRARELHIDAIPKNIADALRYDDPERQLQFHTGTPGAVGTRSAMFHGQGVGTDDTKDRILRYFRQIDKGLQTLFHREEFPLVLAGVEYLFPVYRQANTYSHLLDVGITGNPEGMPLEELHQRAYSVVQPIFQKAFQDGVTLYRQLADTDKASHHLELVVPAAYHGRVEFLFVALGVHQWGAFNQHNNKVEIHDIQESGDEDLLNLAAAETIIHGGTVHAVAPAKVPAHSSLAAVFRY